MIETAEDLDSDEEADNFATVGDISQSPLIERILRDEPAEKIYFRREDFRVGGYRYAPLKLVKSFQKQRCGAAKWQFKYHEAEMMDLDQVRPRLTLIPTAKNHRKREH